MRSSTTFRSATRTTAVSTKPLLDSGNTLMEVLLKLMDPMHQAQPPKNNRHIPRVCMTLSIVAQLTHKSIRKPRNPASILANPPPIISPDPVPTTKKTWITILKSRCQLSRLLVSSITSFPHERPTCIREYEFLPAQKAKVSSTIPGKGCDPAAIT